MNELLVQLLEVVELGKADQKSPFPPQLKGQDGASELTTKALEAGVSPQDILENALIPAMDKVGKKFSENKIFVPQMLMSARAMVWKWHCISLVIESFWMIKTNINTSRLFFNDFSD
jgi:hypothetical protein